MFMLQQNALSLAPAGPVKLITVRLLYLSPHWNFCDAGLAVISVSLGMLHSRAAHDQSDVRNCIQAPQSHVLFGGRPPNIDWNGEFSAAVAGRRAHAHHPIG
jgi:hypothetical protein